MHKTGQIQILTHFHKFRMLQINSVKLHEIVNKLQNLNAAFSFDVIITSTQIFIIKMVHALYNYSLIQIESNQVLSSNKRYAIT
jgi:hypothetical protein